LKLLEKIVASLIQRHMDMTGLYDIIQSA